MEGNSYFILYCVNYIQNNCIQFWVLYIYLLVFFEYMQCVIIVLDVDDNSVEKDLFLCSLQYSKGVRGKSR